MALLCLQGLQGLLRFVVGRDGELCGRPSARCVRAGLEMLQTLVEMNPYIETVTRRRIAIGIRYPFRYRK